MQRRGYAATPIKTDSAEEFAALLTEEIKKFTSDSLTAIGIGIPGIAKDGKVINLPNIPILNGYPLSAKLKEIFGCEVYTDNDANLAALSQYRHLGLTGNMVYITVSTGIGAGIIINDNIFQGDNGAAGAAEIDGSAGLRARRKRIRLPVGEQAV